MIAPKQSFDFAYSLGWDAKFLAEHAPGFREHDLTGKELVLGKKKTNDIGAEPTRRKAAYEHICIEENAHAPDL
jgi:hypothetical protein